jgi:3,4-dihydroxy-9,10-secoandrosta-1,3,5(10)-triene-9,17-dione 4,5-dioxygenase
MPVRQLGYVHWSTNKFEEWRTFAIDVFGFMPVTGADPDSMYFRWDERPYRLIVTPADAPNLVAIGFEVADDLELAELATTLGDNGFAVSMGSEAEALEKKVTGFLHFTDPAGITIELFYGPILDHVPVVTPLVSGFVTGDMGMGHIVIDSTDIKASQHLYRDLLGFHRRNTMRADLGDGKTVSMHFYGCNPRHHTLAIWGDEIPGHMSHFMVEGKTIDDVGRALDRCADNNVKMESGLGRHTNDHMISFYCHTPDGAAAEFGYSGIRVEDASKETTYEITAPSFWGHRPPIEHPDVPAPMKA